MCTILFHINHCQLHSMAFFPLGDYSKSYYFLLLLTQASSLMKAGKAHAVCLSPREDCIFYLSPLGFIFTVNSWLKCNQPRNPPYVLSCHSSLLASRVKHRRGKKKLNTASQAIKIRKLEFVKLRSHRCALIGFKWQKTRGGGGRDWREYNLKEC